MHQSFWSEKPMAHLAVMDDRIKVPVPAKSHWDWPNMVSHWNLPDLNGETVTVAVFTSCDSAELFVDGKSLGVKKKSETDDLNGILKWQVV